MAAKIRVRDVCLDVPAFLQSEREARGWGHLLFGAMFDPPRRQLIRLLDGISFELAEGDRLAILGRNGAGKSTLLRVLNRVYQPTSGSLEIEGSCQAMLNMWLGFNGEATVLENIFLRGIAMGLPASFLRTQVESILSFSGLEAKTNHRLRTLSSGQKMRLGFAISTSVQHDVMLMDEWVGTGDAEFMTKATERMQSRVGRSKIVVLASHSTGLLRSLCNRGIVLEQGQLVYAGTITEALSAYHDLLAKLRSENTLPVADEAPAATSGAQVFGCVESIRVADGLVALAGWLVDTEGGIPSGLAIEARGQRHAAATVEFTRRPDVQRHFGLADDRCGFRAVVPVPGIVDAAELGSGMRVLGGQDMTMAEAPLRIAPKVRDAVGNTRTQGAS